MHIRRNNLIAVIKRRERGKREGEGNVRFLVLRPRQIPKIIQKGGGGFRQCLFASVHFIQDALGEEFDLWLLRLKFSLVRKLGEHLRLQSMNRTMQ